MLPLATSEAMPPLLILGLTHAHVCIPQHCRAEEISLESDDKAGEEKSTEGQWKDGVLFLSELIILLLQIHFFLHTDISMKLFFIFYFIPWMRKRHQSIFRDGE